MTPFNPETARKFVQHIGVDYFECLIGECTHILPCEDPSKAQFEELTTTP